MCGRYQLQIPARDLESSHQNTTWRTGQSSRYFPRQQLRPTNVAPVLVARRSRAASQHNSECELTMMKWGMHAVGSAQQQPRLIINARTETVLQLPTFRSALMMKDGSRRCAVPATGFYEWHGSPSPGRTKPSLTPFLVGKSTEQNSSQQNDLSTQPLFYMAGIYNSIPEADREEDAFCFVIMTTEACKRFQWLHNRQPVFLSSAEEVAKWLDEGVDPTAAVGALRIEENLAWTRMNATLTEAVEGKMKVQTGLKFFFKKQPALAETAETETDKKKLITPVHSPKKKLALKGKVNKQKLKKRAASSSTAKTDIWSVFKKNNESQ